MATKRPSLSALLELSLDEYSALYVETHTEPRKPPKANPANTAVVAAPQPSFPYERMHYFSESYARQQRERQFNQLMQQRQAPCVTCQQPPAPVPVKSEKKAVVNQAESLRKDFPGLVNHLKEVHVDLLGMVRLHFEQLKTKKICLIQRNKCQVAALRRRQSAMQTMVIKKRERAERSLGAKNYKKDTVKSENTKKPRLKFFNDQDAIDDDDEDDDDDDFDKHRRNIKTENTIEENYVTKENEPDFKYFESDDLNNNNKRIKLDTENDDIKSEDIVVKTEKADDNIAPAVSEGTRVLAIPKIEKSDSPNEKVNLEMTFNNNDDDDSKKQINKKGNRGDRLRSYSSDDDDDDDDVRTTFGKFNDNEFYKRMFQ